MSERRVQGFNGPEGTRHLCTHCQGGTGPLSQPGAWRALARCLGPSREGKLHLQCRTCWTGGAWLPCCLHCVLSRRCCCMWAPLVPHVQNREGCEVLALLAVSCATWWLPAPAPR